MNDDIIIGKQIRIRDRGLDEFWLQDQIVKNPSCLGMGELEVISKERKQSSGGRLDILLKDPEDDSMFEVEVMLGETDESHIIRAIEYWDNEKRKWPKRQHTAVLIAESITRRFFNVIQLLSHAIPIIAIQVNIIEGKGQNILNFIKVLDTYEEPEDDSSIVFESHDEAYWRSYSPWTLDVARALEEVLSDVLKGGSLKYLKYYISFSYDNNNYFALHRRGGNKSLLMFWLPPHLIDKAETLLNDKGLSYVKKTDEIRMTIDVQSINKDNDLFKKLGVLVKQGWEE